MIQVYDYTLFEAIYQLTAYGNIQHMFYDEKENMLLALTNVKIGDSPKVFLGFEKIYFETE